MRPYFMALLCALSSAALAAQRRPNVQAVHATVAVGSIEGDMYYVLPMSGDIKQGAGRTVYLLPDVDSFRSARLAFCAEARDGWRRVTDSLLAPANAASDSSNALYRQFDDAMASRNYSNIPPDLDRLLARTKVLYQKVDDGQANFMSDAGKEAERVATSHAVSYTSTGMHAHFVFDSVPPGDYLLFADWYVPGVTAQVRWLVPVSVRSGSTTNKDLDRDNRAGWLLDCPERAAAPNAKDTLSALAKARRAFSYGH